MTLNGDPGSEGHCDAFKRPRPFWVLSSWGEGDLLGEELSSLGWPQSEFVLLTVWAVPDLTLSGNRKEAPKVDPLCSPTPLQPLPPNDILRCHPLPSPNPNSTTPPLPLNARRSRSQAMEFNGKRMEFRAQSPKFKFLPLSAY